MIKLRIATRSYLGRPIATTTWPKSYPIQSISQSSAKAFDTQKYTDEAYIHSCCSDLAFAFDIDGVLLRGSTALPGASRALKFLRRIKVPFVLVTNGGGKTERRRVAELSTKLDVPIQEENFLQAHTPFKDLVYGTATQEALENKTILVTGGHGEKCREVALQYGFKSVVTPADIMMGDPDIWPFNQIFFDHYQSNHRALPVPIAPNDAPRSLKIDAIFVFNDPRDWALDTQIILDLLFSREGYLGTYSKKNGQCSLPNQGWQQDHQPRLYFSNPDLYWAAKYHLPRLGQGGFQAAFLGVWNAATNNAALDRTVIGKPSTLTFRYAEKVLLKYRRSLLCPQAPKLKQVWFVGDNELTDIKGANEYNSENGIDWKSILVATGVYQNGSLLKHQPTMQAENVEEAIKRVIDSRLKTAN
ncbi:hypothetical protein K3495_g14019 [Podosphaera aphanis]|nr:hypothetical protein K3495_g14019 [Podosphaera aphanis]